MRLGSPSPTPGDARLTRLAWVLSFTITVAVISLLLAVKAAQASALTITAGPASAPLATVALPDEEDEEEAEFESDEEEEEDEEEDESGDARASAEPPAECGLRTARAAVVADESQARLRTQISYTSFDPVDVAIEFRLSGGKGSLTLGREHRRLSASGVVRASERLGKGQLEKALAARSITVTVHVLDAPGSCRRYFDRHLRGRHAAGDRVTWVQSDSVFGG